MYSSCDGDCAWRRVDHIYKSRDTRRLTSSAIAEIAIQCRKCRIERWWDCAFNSLLVYVAVLTVHSVSINVAVAMSIHADNNCYNLALSSVRGLPAQQTSVASLSNFSYLLIYLFITQIHTVTNTIKQNFANIMLMGCFVPLQALDVDLAVFANIKLTAN